ncbi:protein kinase [Pendulispora rubella]|uniref:Protein kinase n=1 Tax=Pendulispora rubella TaxID=2741070 RepID=A0ABZ2LFR8_9BACT
MRPGHLLADRFEVDALRGAGGMGAIYRALDRRTGDYVAIKVLRDDLPEHRGRFAREVSLLEGLRHPHIVRYIAHGEEPAGDLYLAMEWLDGMDLQRRLARGPLDVPGALALARALALALGHAHGLGIVHRDLKPSNLFLLGGDPARVKIVDFGVARALSRSAMTMAGGIVGTPGYMAPEQIRGEPAIDARSDLFALGCILFEVLAGRPAFAAKDVLALMFKVLVEDPPPLRSLCPELPAALEALIHRLLAKYPGQRPQSASEVDAELRTMASELELGVVSQRAIDAVDLGAVLTPGEQGVVCVVLAGYPPRKEDTTSGTLPSEWGGDRRARLRHVGAQFRANMEWLPDGTMMALLPGGPEDAERTLPPGHGAARTRSAVDQVVLAARCALAMRDELPRASWVVGTGRAELRDEWPIGAVVDRAVSLLGDVPSGAIAVDDTSARLLEPRFRIADGRLLETRDEPTMGRQLFGRPSRFVGRDRELGNLRAILDGCLEDRRPGAVLVTGPAGMGKSRLIYEFLADVHARHPDVDVWSACADQVSGNAPLWMLAQALRHAAGSQRQASRAAIAEKLEARLVGCIREAQMAEVRALLEELFGEATEEGAPAPASHVPRRLDPSVRAERVRRGFLALLSAECARHPVIVVLDDIQWADGASLRFFDAALGYLAEAPLLVIGVARPEVRDAFPRLWTNRRLEEFRLPNLRPRAAADLARHALGDAHSEDVVERVVARADGNPFYLEELLRAVVEGHGEALPETVLAMTIARIDLLEPYARQVLRAASIFGESFREAEVRALLESPDDRERMAHWLTLLVEHEVLVRVDTEDAASASYRFRHAYLREAAYSTLTEANRILGHRLAAEWLERSGGAESAIVAEHYMQAGDARASVHYLAAARQALRRSDPEGAIDLTSRAAHGPEADRETVDQLRTVHVRARVWRGEFSAVSELAHRTMTTAQPGSKDWWPAAGLAIKSDLMLGHSARARRNLRRFGEARPSADALPTYIETLGSLLPLTYYACAHSFSERLYRQFAEHALPAAETDGYGRGVWLRVAGVRALTYCDDPWEALKLVQTAIPLFEAAGDTQQVLHLHGEVALILGDVADFDAHESESRNVLRGTSHMALGPTIGAGQLAYNLAELGRAEHALVDWALERAVERGFATGEGTVRAGRAAILLLEGRFDEAEREALQATRLTLTVQRFAALAFTALVRARLALGRIEAALRASRAAMALATVSRSIGPTEVGLFLVRAEALHAAGDVAGARTAIGVARERIGARAERCKDPGARRRYLEGVPAVARTLSLANAWLEPLR